MLATGMERGGGVGKRRITEMLVIERYGQTKKNKKKTKPTPKQKGLESLRGG